MKMKIYEFKCSNCSFEYVGNKNQFNNHVNCGNCPNCNICNQPTRSFLVDK